MIVSAGKCIIFRDVLYLHTLLPVVYVQLNVSTETDPQAELAGRCREVSLRVKRIDKTPERTVAYCGQVQAACDRMIDSRFVSD